MRTSLLSLAFAASLSANAHAETPPVPDAASTTFGPRSDGNDDSAHELDAIKVQGARMSSTDMQTSRGSVMFGNVDLRETPFTVNVVGEEDIRRMHAVGLSDILVNDPAFTPGYGAHGGGVSEATGSLRGFATSQVILDGIQLSDINIPETELLERVEVLRGPAAFRYGFLAPGGAINQVGKKPLDHDRFIVSATADSWGKLSGQADISTRFGADDRFGLRLNLVGSKGDVFINEIEQTRRLFGLALEYRISDDTRALFNFSHTYARSDQGDFGVGNVISYDNDGDFNPDGLLPGLGPKYNYAQDYVYNRDNKNRYAITFESALTESLDFYTNLQYVTLDEQFATLFFYDVRSNGDAVAEDGFGVYDWDDISNTTYLSGTFTTGPIRHRVTGGYTAHLSNFKNNFLSGRPVAINLYNRRPYTPTAPRDKTPTNNSETNRYGVFVSDQFDIGERWHGVVGLRWSQIEFKGFDYNTGAQTYVVKNQALTPMGGVLFDLTENIGLYASGGTGLEPGGRAPDDALNAQAQMPALESRMFEAGIKSAWFDGTLTLDAATFAIERTSEYYLGPGTEYGQYGKARHVGGELLVKGLIGTGLKLTGGVQYIDATQMDTGDPRTEGKRSPFVPRWQGSLEADYAFARLTGLSVMARAVGQGRLELSNQDTQFESRGYVRFDAGLRYERAFGRFDVATQLSVENIGDIVYYQGQLQYGVPRTVVVGVDVRW